MKHKNNTPENQPSLFADMGDIEKRGRAAALVEAQKRLGKNLSAFIPWYFENNPTWMENALREIMAAAVESLRDFIGRQAEEQIPSPFSVEFRFPVSIYPHSLYVEPPPELDLVEIPPGELAAFRERGQEISAATVECILTEKAAEAARDGRTAPTITVEQRAEAIRHAAAAGEGLIAENAERNLQADLGKWFTEWRWAFAINSGWTNYPCAETGAAPEQETLCLFHFPDPARKEPDPLWKSSRSFAFRLQTLQALAENCEKWEIPGGDSPEAIEGKRLFESLCPDGMLSRLSIPIGEAKGETDPDKETGERKKIAFNIALEIHPLTFDFRGDGGAELAEPETYFPLVLFCDSGPGAVGWHELTPEERGELFRRFLEMIESMASPENWDFPGWHPLLDGPDQGEEKQERKPRRKRGGGPQAEKMGREEIKRRLKPARPRLELSSRFEARSHKVGRILTAPEKIENPAQFLLPFDLKPGVPAGNWKNAEIVTVGFDFDIHERRVIDGMERLFEQYGFPDSLVVMTDIETFAKACDAEKRATGKDQVARFSGRELCDLLAAVQSVASKKGMFIYDDPDYPRMTLTTTGYLWQPITGFSDLTPEEKENLKNLKFTEGMRAKLRTIGIRFDPLWKRAERGTTGKALYYHRPANLREQLFIAGYFRRSTQTETFLTWLFSEGEPIMHGHREYGNEPAIEISLARLAGICRLDAYMRRRDKKRAAREIIKAASFAKAVGLITNDPAAAFDQEREIFRFEMKDGKHWNDLHAWQAEKKEAEEKAKAEKAEREREKASRKQRKAAAKTEKESSGQSPFHADLEAAEKERMSHLSMLVKEWKENGWDSKRKAITEFSSAAFSEMRKEGNRKDINPEERTARCAMLKRVFEASEAALRGGCLPPARTKARPALVQAPAQEKKETAPVADKEAAKIWNSFVQSLPEEMANKAAFVIPARIEKTEEATIVFVWIPISSLSFTVFFADFQSRAWADGFVLKQLEPGGA